MSDVRAKFVCQNIQQNWSGQGVGAVGAATVRLTPVYGDDNKTWARYTPSGQIEMQIDNPAAVGKFQVGQTYFVDFTAAPAKEADEK